MYAKDRPQNDVSEGILNQDTKLFKGKHVWYHMMKKDSNVTRDLQLCETGLLNYCAVITILVYF